MAKHSAIFAFFCILLTLLLAGCGGTGIDIETSPDDDSSPTIIYAPTDKPDDINVRPDNRPVTTDTEKPVPADTTAEPDETADTEPVMPPFADTDAETTVNAPEPEDTTAPPEPEDTAEETTVPELPIELPPDVDIINLTGQLTADKPVSGKIISKQSEKLRLMVKYDCKMDADGEVTIQFDVGLEVFDINCGARIDMGKFSIDGDTRTYSTNALSNSNHQRTFMPFTSHTYRNTDGQTSCYVDVSWPFNGVYGGETIKDLTASAILRWSDEQTEYKPTTEE